LKFLRIPNPITSGCVKSQNISPTSGFKGHRNYYFSQKWFEKNFAEKTIKIISEVMMTCTAAAHFISIILDVVVLKNI
jgi:hypothetical protein